MYRWERTMRKGGSGIQHEREIPSFSSSLLDEIYRSIDEEGRTDLPREPGFYANVVCEKKKSKCGTKAGEVEVLDRIGRDKAGYWAEKSAKERETIQKRQVSSVTEKKQRRNRNFAQDSLFFTSASSSSDSSSNGFSSSDTESAYSGVKNRTSCFLPLPIPKPVRTSDRTGSRTEFSPFREQGKLPGFDGGDEGIINSKSKALKIYTNLKKIKHPISPGGKLASFVNSLFAASNTPRKSKQSALSSVSSFEEKNLKGKFKSGDSPACSSASYFTRSWKLHNVSKRTVQLYPLDEGRSPYGEKSVNQEREEFDKENANLIRFVSSPSARNIEKNVRQKIASEPRMEMSGQVEEAAREFLRNYHRNQKKKVKTTAMTSQINHRNSKNDDDRDYEDDAASCTSSDLFELDHLSVLGDDMYCEELPVYGTTCVGLIM